jgi:hypothetical protein
MKTSWARPKWEYLTLEEQCGKGAGEPGGSEGTILSQQETYIYESEKNASGTHDGEFNC